MPALDDHAAQFGPECIQIPKLSVNLGKMFARDRVHGFARDVFLVGELEKLLHLVDRETERASPADETEPREMLWSVSPIIALRPSRRRKLSDAFIIANCLDLRSGRFRELSDAERLDGHIG